MRGCFLRGECKLSSGRTESFVANVVAKNLNEAIDGWRKHCIGKTFQGEEGFEDVTYWEGTCVDVIFEKCEDRMPIALICQ